MDKLWIWGSTLSKIPGSAEGIFAPEGSYCSLETAMEYMNAERAFFMNSITDINNLTEENFSYIKNAKEVIVPLTEGDYMNSIIAIAEFSKHHPNISGVLIDDFLMRDRPISFITVDELKELYETMKNINPKLKLWVVRYSRDDMNQIDPYLQYIDGINFWIWNSTEHYWDAVYREDIIKLKNKGKPIIQGVFLHDYGTDFLAPMSVEKLKNQLPKITNAIRVNHVDSIVLLQSGWFNREDHREAIQWTKSYLEWFFGTYTVR